MYPACRSDSGGTYGYRKPHHPSKPAGRLLFGELRPPFQSDLVHRQGLLAGQDVSTRRNTLHVPAQRGRNNPIETQPNCSSISMVLETEFSYPPLPVAGDGIRVLTLQPGDFYDSLVCILNPVAFSENPRYVAISYTWGNPFPDANLPPTSPPDQAIESLSLRTASTFGNPSLPESQIHPPTDVRRGTDGILAEISVNGRPFWAGRNLVLALRHLRSPTHSLLLWVDAICINQANTAERNAQVSLMAFVYARAQRVIAWLGPSSDGRRTHTDAFHAMAVEWRMGRTRHLAEWSTSSTAPARCSPPPDLRTFAHLAKSVYWTRLWVVQEACLPRLLVFVYGARVWEADDLPEWDVFVSARLGASKTQAALHRSPGDDAIQPMLRLIEARADRHSAAMTLERLVEAFSRQKCTELRDRIYGLLGLANDVNPFPSGMARLSRSKWQQRVNESFGRIKVDYSASFFDLWVEVMRFMLHGPETRFKESGIAEGLKRKAIYPITVTVTPEYLERSLTITRAATVLQQALDQNVEEEAASQFVLVVST
jgi:hypothetical protein